MSPVSAKAVAAYMHGYKDKDQEPGDRCEDLHPAGWRGSPRSSGRPFPSITIEPVHMEYFCNTLCLCQDAMYRPMRWLYCPSAKTLG